MSPEVQKAYDVFKSAGESDEVFYGPGHIVFDDYNLGDSSILFCLDPANWFEYFNFKSKGITTVWEFQEFFENLTQVYKTLQALLDIPEEDREALSEYLWENE